MKEMLSYFFRPKYTLERTFEYARSGVEDNVLTALTTLMKSVSAEELMTSVDSREWSLLQYIATNGLTRAAHFLLDYAQHNTSEEALSRALAYTGSAGHTALLMSVINKHEEIACELIKRNAAFDGKSSRERNCIFMLARNGMTTAMSLLWNTRSQESITTLGNAVDTNGYTALHAAALMGHIEMCQLLLSYHIDGVCRTCKDGSNTLHIACRLSPHQGNSEISAATIQTLLEYILPRLTTEQLLSPDTSPLLTADTFGSTPLHIASACGNLEAVRIITQFIPSVDILIAQDNDGYHPTHIACHALVREVENWRRASPSNSQEAIPDIRTSVCVLECLMKAGYPPCCVDYTDSTVLHCLAAGLSVSSLHLGACEAILLQALGVILEVAENRHELTRLLLQENTNGWTCFHMARSKLSTPDNFFFAVMSSHLAPEAMASLDLARPKRAETDRIPPRLRCGGHNRIPLETRKSLLQGDYSTQGVCAYLKRLPHTPRVVVVVGAGISTSAGIKDFRSADGLYADRNTSQLFSVEFLTTQPDKFYAQLKDIFMPVIDGIVQPTKAHALLRLLSDMGWLVRVYTQNIDMLEQCVGLRSNQIVECHGSCSRAYCINTNCEGNRYRIDSDAEMRRLVWSVIRGSPTHAPGRPSCELCGSLLRPDVTFFGEPLPPSFDLLSRQDLPNCDLVLVMGTSLVVYPVAGLPQMVSPYAVRMLVNREPTGCFQFVPPAPPAPSPAHAPQPPPPITEAHQRYDQWDTSQYRDVYHCGSCDEGAEVFAEALVETEAFKNIVLRYCKQE